MKHKMDVYIIEDNLSHLKEIEKTISEFSNSSSILDLSLINIPNYIEFYKNIHKYTFNPESLFIIDIHLHTYFNGFDLAKKLRIINDDFFIMFLTNDPSFGINAINTQIHPFSYILKSEESNLFFKEEFYNALNMLQSEKSELLNSNRTLAVKVGLEKFFINISDILYISSIKGWRGKVVLKTIHSEMICNGKISEYKDKLDSTDFFLNAKSVIINHRLIRSLHRIEGTVTFTDQSELFVGTSIVNKLNKFYRYK